MLFLSILQDKRKKLENLPDDLEVYRGIALKKKVLPEKQLYDVQVQYPVSKEEKVQLLAANVDGFEFREGKWT